MGNLGGKNSGNISSEGARAETILIARNLIMRVTFAPMLKFSSLNTAYFSNRLCIKEKVTLVNYFALSSNLKKSRVTTCNYTSHTPSSLNSFSTISYKMILFKKPIPENFPMFSISVLLILPFQSTLPGTLWKEKLTF